MQTVTAPLKDKIAVVTGASRGIGACIAETFARQGCTHIAITYNSKKNLAEEVEARIRGINSSIKTCSFPLDVCDPQAGEKTVREALQGLGVDRIDIVVCGAAMADVSQFLSSDDMTIEHWNKVMTANAWTPFATTREVAKVMPAGGRVIFLSSAASKVPQGEPFIAYSASKSAMDTLARNMSTVFGQQRNGITVNTISIGPIDTDALRAVYKQMGPEFQKQIEEYPLIKRIGQPQEVADIVAFVASPASSFIVGNQIPANGGTVATLQS